MKQLLKTFAASILLLSQVAWANDDVSEITQVIQKYFDGTSKGQPELVSQAFTPSLELQFVDKNGELQRWLGTDYISRIKPGRVNSRVGKIISMDITDNAAVVKATVTTTKTVFTDYLLLLKLDSGWKITNKTFTKTKKITN